MDDGSRLPDLMPWLFAVALLFAAMYFAVTETSIASASRSKIKAAAERGEVRAKRALYVMDNFDRAISTILIGTNIVHISIATIVTVAVTKLWGISWVSLLPDRKFRNYAKIGILTRLFPYVILCFNLQ